MWAAMSPPWRTAETIRCIGSDVEGTSSRLVPGRSGAGQQQRPRDRQAALRRAIAWAGSGSEQAAGRRAGSGMSRAGGGRALASQVAVQRIDLRKSSTECKAVTARPTPAGVNDSVATRAWMSTKIRPSPRIV